MWLDVAAADFGILSRNTEVIIVEQPMWTEESPKGAWDYELTDFCNFSLGRVV